MFALSAVNLQRRWFTGEEHIDKFYNQVKIKTGARNAINFSHPFFNCNHIKIRIVYLTHLFIIVGLI